MYRVVFTQRAQKDIEDINLELRKEIAAKLNEYSLKYARKLTNPKIGTYRFTIGDYRIIFDTEGIDIVVLRIEYRKGNLVIK